MSRVSVVRGHALHDADRGGSRASLAAHQRVDAVDPDTTAPSTQRASYTEFSSYSSFSFSSSSFALNFGQPSPSFFALTIFPHSGYYYTPSFPSSTSYKCLFFPFRKVTAHWLHSPSSPRHMFHLPLSLSLSALFSLWLAKKTLNSAAFILRPAAASALRL